MSGRAPLPYEESSNGSVAERPDKHIFPNASFVQVSPFFSNSQSGKPFRRSDFPFAIVLTGVAWERPLLASLPALFETGYETLGV